MLKLNYNRTDLIKDDSFYEAKQAVVLTVGNRVVDVLDANGTYEPLWASFPLPVSMENAEELLHGYPDYNCDNSIITELSNMVIDLEAKAYFAKAFNHLIDISEVNHG